MRIGLMAWDIGGTDLIDLARAADALGFDAVWLGERTVLPVAYQSRHPAPGAAPTTAPVEEMTLVDTTVVLGAAAAATAKIHLATGIYLLALRHPLHSALAAATLAELSNGRFMMGVGSGWLEEEFTILDVPFRQRHRRVTEAIEIMRAAWAGGVFEYHGECYSFGPCQITREPVGVPLILGGNTPRALDRAAVLGDGWISSRTPSFDDAVDFRRTLLEVREEHGLVAPFRCYCRIAGADTDTFERYQDAGFEDVIIRADELWPSNGTKEQKVRQFRSTVLELGIGSRDDGA